MADAKPPEADPFRRSQVVAHTPKKMETASASPEETPNAKRKRTETQHGATIGGTIWNMFKLMSPTKEEDPALGGEKSEHEELNEPRRLFDALATDIYKATEIAKAYENVPKELNDLLLSISRTVKALSPTQTAEKIEAGTQTPNAEETTTKETEAEVHRIREGLKNGKPTPEVWKTQWPEEAYLNTKVSDFNSEAEHARVRIVVLPKSADNDKNIRAICDSTQNLKAVLNAKEFTEGEIAVIGEQTAIHFGNECRKEGRTTVAVRPPQTGDKLEAVRSALAGALQKIDGLPNTLTVITGCGITRTRKALEALLIDSHGVMAVVCPSAPGTTMRRPRPANAKIEIEGKGLSYADLVKQVKSSIDIQKEGIDVSAIKKRGEKVEVTVRGGEDKAMQLLEAVNKVRTDAVVANLKTRMSTYDLSGIDADANKEDIEAALENTYPESRKESLKVVNVRPTYAGTQRATVLVEEVLETQVRQMPFVRIGWSTGKMVKRQQPDQRKCYRCWETGHQAAACNGPDRRKCCFKCGKDGHARFNCPNERSCPVCKVDGHSLGESGCTVSEGEGFRRPRPQ